MTQDTLELALDNANKVLTTNITELTFEEKLKANDVELVRAVVTAMNSALVSREAMSHAAATINGSMKLYIERDPSVKVSSKKYNYLLNKIREFDKYFIPLIKSLEKTIGVENLQRGFEDSATEIYSAMYEEVEVVDKENS